MSGFTRGPSGSWMDELVGTLVGVLTCGLPGGRVALWVVGG